MPSENAVGEVPVVALVVEPRLLRDALRRVLERSGAIVEAMAGDGVLDIDRTTRHYDIAVTTSAEPPPGLVADIVLRVMPLDDDGRDEATVDIARIEELFEHLDAWRRDRAIT